MLHDYFNLQVAKIWVLILSVLASLPAYAQHADENAVTSAEDAFGTTIGLDSIGIYSTDSVRGFSPTVAGNVRIDGLYFDIQSSPNGRVIGDAAIRVGIAAQGQTFPAPTGIADLSLRTSSATPQLSIIGGYGPYNSEFAILDGQLPLHDDALTTTAGVSMSRDRLANGGGDTTMAIGFVPRWRLSDHVEFTAFWGRTYNNDESAAPIYIPDRLSLPPRVQQGKYPGPRWTVNNYFSDNAGLLGRAREGNWTIRAGLFHSLYNGLDTAYANYFAGVESDGNGEHIILAAPPLHAESMSGEVRVAHERKLEQFHQVITGSIRWRDVKKRYGGDALLDAGITNVNSPAEIEQPVFEFGAQTSDRTSQFTPGISYSLAWNGVGEIGVGIQHTDYLKRELRPNAERTRLTAPTWLPTATLAVNIEHTIAAYGSFVQGLEDSGSAPDNAINRGQPAPAIRTQQYDVGMRWTPTSTTKLIVGYFKINKPYLTVDTLDVYRRIGSETHRGVEMSLSAAPLTGLTVLVGGVFSSPSVSGIANAGEVIGSRPVGQPNQVAQLNIDYELPFARRVSLDAGVNHVGSQVATVDNSVYVPAYTTLAVGGRYKFKAGGKPYLLRVSMSNVTNVRAWSVFSAGAYQPIDQCSFSAYLAADF